jgi:chromatin segregation and condensation protein Rec8/ScpA/Scc1 (kleisin family)
MKPSEALELVRADLMALAELVLAPLLEELEGRCGPEEASVELVALARLARMRLEWLLEVPEADEEDPEADRVLEGALVGLMERSIFAAAARAMRGRLAEAGRSAPVRVEVPELPEAPPERLAVAELKAALTRALDRALEVPREETVQVAPREVDLRALGRVLLARLETTRSFRELARGAAPIEVIVWFVLLLECSAFGAVQLMQSEGADGEDIAIEVIDASRLGLVAEMVETLG